MEECLSEDLILEMGTLHEAAKVSRSLLGDLLPWHEGDTEVFAWNDSIRVLFKPFLTECPLPDRHKSR